MSGVKNTGVVNSVSNQVVVFPQNSITVDIFGNAFYRDYSFGAGDDVGVYWNESRAYSRETNLCITVSINKALRGMYSYGHKLRSSQSHNIAVLLPTENGEPDYDFMDGFITRLEHRYVKELEEQRQAKIKSYEILTGHSGVELTQEEQAALDEYNRVEFVPYDITEVFDIRNTGCIMGRDIIPGSGETPYLCASAENNAVSSYISYDKCLPERGNCIFIGGKTFVVTYQEQDFYSNDSHNLALYPKHCSESYYQLFLVTCLKRSLSYKYSWGNSVSRDKIVKDKIYLPMHDTFDYDRIKIFMSAIEKLDIKLMGEMCDRKIHAARSEDFASRDQ